MESQVKLKVNSKRSFEFPSETVLIRQIRQEKFDNLNWSSGETLFKKRHKSKLLGEREIPFSLAAFVRFRKTVFGTYLEPFNYRQNQDKYWNKNKYDIMNWDMKELTPLEKFVLQEKDNNISDNLVDLLVKAVNETDCINLEFLYEHLITLRISDSYVKSFIFIKDRNNVLRKKFQITFIDKELRNFRNIQVLVLSGNWIRDICGRDLPRKIRFLELYANEISDITNLCLKAPETLLHIGLGRNKLTDGCNFHLLKKCGKFESLRTLDLSDNDIFELLNVLKQLEGLKLLTGLNLEGNPCATYIGYKDAVLSLLPQLLYLDDTQILNQDRDTNDALNENSLHNAALIFTCHRITGLPAPPKQKGLIQTIHIEVTFPLLEEVTLESPEDPEEELEEEVKEDKKKAKKKVKDKSGKSSKKAKSAKSKSTKSKKQKVKKPSPYEVEDEYETEKKLRIKNTSFKTERIPWAKIMQFPEEALIIESPEKDVSAIRDTFRSSVNVKVVYLKIQPPQKVKKGKGKGDKKVKGSKKDSKKGSKKGVKKDEETSTKPAKTEEPKEPQETILKKITLANFFCDLRSLNWSDRTLDFYWADHPQSNPNAIPVEGSLRAINYIEGKAKKKEKKSTKSTETAIDVVEVPSKQFLPNIFTCQVGFGLKRSFPTV